MTKKNQQPVCLRRIRPRGWVCEKGVQIASGDQHYIGYVYDGPVVCDCWNQKPERRRENDC